MQNIENLKELNKAWKQWQKAKNEYDLKETNGEPIGNAYKLMEGDQTEFEETVKWI